MVHRTTTVAESRVRCDRSGDECFRFSNSFDQRLTSGEAGGDRCRIGAAGAVSVPCVDARTRQFDPFTVGEQIVRGRTVGMAALDERSSSAEFDEAARLKGAEATDERSYRAKKILKGVRESVEGICLPDFEVPAA